MGRGATWIVVGALLAVAGFAAADALRGGKPELVSADRTSTSADTSRAAQAQLRGAGIAGTLYYTDYADSSCRLRAVALPTLELEEAPQWEGTCRFSLSPDGSEVDSEGTVWDARRGRRASSSTLSGTDRSPSIVVTDSPSRIFEFRATAPAFRPDGVLTYTFNGAIWALRSDCPTLADQAIWLAARAVRACSRELLTRADLLAAAQRHPVAGSDPRLVRRLRVAEVVWIDEHRLAVVLTFTIQFRKERATVVAFFEDASARGVVSDLGLAFPRHLRTSSTGLVAGVTPGGGTIGVFDGNGHTVPFTTPSQRGALPFRGVRDIDWSPNGQWLAVATSSSVFLVHPSRERPRVLRVPVSAGDIAWRA